MANDEIRFQRGPENRLPLLDNGEPAITTDTGKLFYGTPSGNVEVPKKKDIERRGIDVTNHGAVGDGVTDSTSAFKVSWAYALTMRISQLFVPEGDYLITDTLTGEPISIIGMGTGQTRLIFQNMSGKDGISFTVATQTGVVGEVAHLSIIAKGQHGKNAIKTADHSSLYSTYRVRYSFHDLEFRGDAEKVIPSGFNYDYGWDCYIDLGDSWGAYIENIDAIGTYDISVDPATQPDQIFLRMQSNGNILTARINRVTIHGIKKGIEIGDKCFFMIDQVDIAHSYEGIYTNGSNIYSEGRISDTLVNSQLRCVHLASRSWTAVSNVAVGRHRNGFNHGLAWYGFYLDDVNKSWFTNLRAQADKTVTAFTGNHYGVYFKNCDGVSVSGMILGSGLTQPVVNDNTAGGTFDNTNFQIDSGGVAAWSFLNNARYIKIGTFDKRSTTPDYFVDETVSKANIQIVQTANMP
jgi:hypothetical protein